MNTPLVPHEDDDAGDDAGEDSGEDAVTPTSQDSNTDTELMHRVDACLSHVWMVRTFLKHSDEATDDEELAEVHRELYDYMLALGPSLDSNHAAKYLRIARKKLSKIRTATELFRSIQPEVSGHMNFRMAAKSLQLAIQQIESLLSEPDAKT